MTEEEFKDAPIYRGWSAGERRTFQALLEDYRTLRLKVGPSVYVTRHMLTEAHGSKHVGTASKFQGYIEEIEDDQPPRGRRAEACREEQGSFQPSPHPAAVQNALNALQAAAEGVSKAVAAERVRASADAAVRYQQLLDDQRSAAEADLAAAQVRIADLEVASVRTGEESWETELVVEELRVGLSAAEMARDEALAAAKDLGQRLEVELAHSNAARTQIEILRKQVAAQAIQVSDLQKDVGFLTEATALGHKLRLENAALIERGAALTDQLERLQGLLREANERHERERASIRITHDRAMAEERQRAGAREAQLLEQIIPVGNGQGGCP